jgi:GNAT superfamily N-acetyltransferase
MWPRLTGAEFRRGRGAGNKRSFRRLIAAGSAPGMIAYCGGAPVGWCGLAPREQYRRLERSRVMARVDDQPVWSVVCFFVDRSARRSGVTTALLRAAVAHAAKRGARIIEGYPLDAGKKRLADTFAWFGLASAFENAGFREVARRSATRPVMRYLVRSRAGGRSPARPRAGAKADARG